MNCHPDRSVAQWTCGFSNIHFGLILWTYVLE